MNDQSWNDPTILKLGASMLGSLISLRFIKGTKIEVLLMFIGGTALSFYATDPVANWVGGGGSIFGLVGFLLGLIGMTIVAKIYEVIQLLDSKQIAKDVWEWVVKKWGA
jgi:hypothetical protein